MITVYCDRHRLHHGTAELIDGVMQPCFEKPQRADMILARVRQAGLGEVVDAGPVDLDAVRRVHDPRYVDFLSTAWHEWTAQGRSNDALPLVWPVPAVRHDRIPRRIDGKLGYFSMDAGVPITAGTWEAVTAGAAVASSAADRIADGAASAFALCRPPGHHAAAAMMGGYYPRLGARIAAIGRPRLFVMEGGYAVDDIGVNAVNVLSGFESV